MNDSFSMFGLTLEQTQVLFSLQKLIILQDIETNTPSHFDKRKQRNENINNGINRFLKKVIGDNDVQIMASEDTVMSELNEVIIAKRKWLAKWEDGISEYLKGLNGGIRVELLSSIDEIEQLFNKLDQSSDNTIWKYLILFECCIFAPYYPKDKQDPEYNTLKKCELYDNVDLLKKICVKLNVDSKYVSQFKQDYDKSIKRLSGYWTKVLVSSSVGVAAALASIVLFQPYTLFAAPGLTGAAAVTSGLATLGGGAIAAGGFGMAGGMAVVLGGGALLGVGAGSSAGAMIAKMSADSVLTESAKMEVILKDIVLAIQKDTKYFQKILIKISEQEQHLKEQVFELQIEGEKNKKKIKELDKKLEYLEKLMFGSRAYSCMDRASA